MLEIDQNKFCKYLDEIIEEKIARAGKLEQEESVVTFGDSIRWNVDASLFDLNLLLESLHVVIDFQVIDIDIGRVDHVKVAPIDRLAFLATIKPSAILHLL